MNFLKFNEFFYFKNQTSCFEKIDYLDNLINFKNQFGFFKKIDFLKNFFFSKNDFNKNINFDKEFLNYDKKKFFIKNYDFSEKKYIYYNSNRNLLKYFFLKNKKRKHYLNKFFKKFSKLNNINYFDCLEFSLKNILLNSNFFLSIKDINFFLKNGFIYLNNKLAKNINKNIKKNDIISIVFNKYYYFLYKNYLNIFNSIFFNKKMFFRKSLNGNLKKDIIYIEKFYYTKNDIKDYIEVDFTTMSIFLVHKNIYVYSDSHLKIYNIFLKRLNN